MSYYAYDSNGYLGDVASGTGWQEFCEWAQNQSGPVATFVEHGSTDDPVALADALDELVVVGDADTEGIRKNLVTIAERANGVLIVSDGVGQED